MLRLYQPQLILLDNFLPDGKGLDLIRHAVSTNYKGRIIFITADNHMDTISEALRLGVFDYLIKPVHYQRLQHTLERFARYRSSLRSSEQASQTHVDALFNIQAREQTEPAGAPLRGSMKVPFIACCSCSPPRKWCIPLTLWLASLAAVKPPPAAIWNKALKTIFWKRKLVMAKSADRSVFIAANIPIRSMPETLTRGYS